MLTKCSRPRGKRRFFPSPKFNQVWCVSEFDIALLIYLFIWRWKQNWICLFNLTKTCSKHKLIYDLFSNKLHEFINYKYLKLNISSNWLKKLTKKMNRSNFFLIQCKNIHSSISYSNKCCKKLKQMFVSFIHVNNMIEIRQPHKVIITNIWNKTYICVSQINLRTIQKYLLAIFYLFVKIIFGE